MKFVARIGIVATMCMVCAIMFSCYDDIDDLPMDQIDGNSYSYIDCTDYTIWTYINLKDGSLSPLPYDEEAAIPAEWTFALHRYDCKTNDGRVVETQFSSLDSFTAAVENGAYRIPDASEFIPDEMGEINIDMSHMMDGYVVTAPSMLNKELGRWLDVDTEYMPPIYTPSNKVYLLLTRDGEYVAILFTGFSNPLYYDTKGYISFSFEYL